MARIRSIKPEFWDDRKLARLVSRDARMLYIGLWNQADEHARCNGDPHWIKGRVFPYDDDLDDDAIGRLLGELVSACRVVEYEVDGDPYLFLPKLAEHQRLEPKVESRLPPPPDPDGSAPRADLSAPDSDDSARDADEYVPRPDNPAPRVRAHSREHVAGGREQVLSGGQAAAATLRNVPRELPPLQAALAEAGMSARWDKLTDDQAVEVDRLIAVHGVNPLVSAARRMHRPDAPAAFAQAWLPGWQALLPPSRRLHVVAATCPEHGCEEPCVSCVADRKAVGG